MTKRLLVAGLALAVVATANAQVEEGGLRRIGVSAFFPHIPRDEFDSAGLSVDLRLEPERGRTFLELGLRGYHADAQDVFIFNPSIGYAVSRGRLGGMAAVGFAAGGSSGGRSTSGLSGTVGATYLLRRDLWADVRYVFVGPDGLGGLTVGLMFGVH